MADIILQCRSLPLGETHPVPVTPERVVATYEAAHPGGDAATESILVLDDGRHLRVADTVANVATAIETASSIEMIAATLSPLGLRSPRVSGGTVVGQVSDDAKAESVDAFNGVRWLAIGDGRVAVVLA